MYKKLGVLFFIALLEFAFISNISCKPDGDTTETENPPPDKTSTTGDEDLKTAKKTDQTQTKQSNTGDKQGMQGGIGEEGLALYKQIADLVKECENVKCQVETDLNSSNPTTPLDAMRKMELQSVLYACEIIKATSPLADQAFNPTTTNTTGNQVPTDPSTDNGVEKAKGEQAD